MNIVEDINVLFTTPAHTLEVGDQIIIDGELFIINTIVETEDIDEVVVKGENLSGDDDTFSLFADDEYQVWAL